MVRRKQCRSSHVHHEMALFALWRSGEPQERWIRRGERETICLDERPGPPGSGYHDYLLFATGREKGMVPERNKCGGFIARSATFPRQDQVFFALTREYRN